MPPTRRCRGAGRDGAHRRAGARSQPRSPARIVRSIRSACRRIRRPCRPGTSLVVSNRSEARSSDARVRFEQSRRILRVTRLQQGLPFVCGERSIAAALNGIGTGFAEEISHGHESILDARRVPRSKHRRISAARQPRAAIAMQHRCHSCRVQARSVTAAGHLVYDESVKSRSHGTGNTRDEVQRLRKREQCGCQVLLELRNDAESRGRNPVQDACRCTSRRRLHRRRRRSPRLERRLRRRGTNPVGLLVVLAAVAVLGYFAYRVLTPGAHAANPVIGSRTGPAVDASDATRHCGEPPGVRARRGARSCAVARAR